MPSWQLKDARFYDHVGIDPIRNRRRNSLEKPDHRKVEGGSTLNPANWPRTFSSKEHNAKTKDE